MKQGFSGVNILAALVALFASAALSRPLLLRLSELPCATDFSHCWPVREFFVSAIHQISSQCDADKFSSLRFSVG